MAQPDAERRETNGEAQTVLDLFARSESATDPSQRAIERFTETVGRPFSLFALVAFVGAWIGFHTLTRSFDPPPFFWLQGLVGLSGLLVATMVLITQNRQGKHEQQRRLLDLQVGFLVEQKVAKLIALVEELRRDLPSVMNRPDPEAEAMARSVGPSAMAESLEKDLEAVKKDPASATGG
jgi:uncharacterized membrane protein